MNARAKHDDPPVRRDRLGDLVFKTNPDARVPEAVVPAVDDFDGSLARLSVDAATYASSKTPRTTPYPWHEWVSKNLDYRQDFMRDVLANIIADLRREMRAAFESELGLVKRELAVLRTEVAVRNLQSEVADARANIPQLPDLEAQFESKQAETRKELARLKRALDTTKDRLTTVHGELSQTRFNLSQLESKTPKPVVTVTLSTSQSTFIVQDDDPAASAAWQRFIENVVESNPDAEGRVDGATKN